MTQDPNTSAQVEPTEIGANAAESGERDLTAPGVDLDTVAEHEVPAGDLDFATAVEQGHTAVAARPRRASRADGRQPQDVLPREVHGTRAPHCGTRAGR